MNKSTKLGLVIFAGVFAVILYLGLLTTMTASAATTAGYEPALEATFPAAPLFAVGGPDTFGYTYQDEVGPSVYPPNFEFIDISTLATATNLALNDDDIADISTGSAGLANFDFQFYGATFSSIRVDNNGVIGFNPVGGNKIGPLNTCLPAGNIIAPWWDDWGSAGDVYWAVLGSAPNRQLIVQWHNMIHYYFGTPPAPLTPVTFQVIFFETSDVILFQYLNTDAGGGFEDGQWGTVGISVDAGNVLEYGCNSSVLADSRVIRFQHSSLEITKVTTPPGGSGFEFSATGGISPSFTLDGGQSLSFDTLPGSYTVTETLLPADWGLANLSCSSALAGVAGFTGVTSDFTIDLAGRTAAVNLLAPGDSVTCVFNNTNSGRILVDKVTDPAGDPADFNFTLSGGPESVVEPFVLSDTTAAYLSDPLKPGTYDLAEAAPEGWDLAEATCDGGSYQNITVAPGETVICVFTNTKRGQIFVDKVTEPAGDPAEFQIELRDQPAGTLLDTFTLSHTTPATHSGFLRTDTTYAVTETAVTGWDLTGLNCDGEDPANITLAAGQSVTCVFTNTKQGAIIVDKVTDPAGNSTSFDFELKDDQDTSLDIFSLSDTATPYGSGNIPPGAYVVTETLTPAGWDLTGATCDNGDAPPNVTVNAGQTVTCVFTNTAQPGRIEIEKVTVPASEGDTEFNFTLTGPNIDETIPVSSTGGLGLSGDLPPGAYSLVETVPAGWSAVSNCGSSVTVNAGQTVRCVFTNTRQGQIFVDKVTDPGGDPATFNFTINGGPGGGLVETIVISDGTALRPSAYLTPGFSYAITETAQSNWDLATVDCGGETPDDIFINPGQTVTCVFTNTKRGQIIVDKVTDPAGNLTSFNFNLSGGPDGIDEDFSLTDGATPHNRQYLLPGALAYVVTETTVTGWDLTGIDCGSEAADDITLAPGQTVTCVFTNTAQPGRIEIEKVTVPASEGDTEFNFTLTGPNVDETIPVSSTGGLGLSGDLPPGAYSLVETVPAGWSAVSNCGSSVTVNAGQTVRCVFTNTKLSRILVDKVTAPAGDPTSFGFRVSGGTINQTFNLTDTSPMYDSGLIQPNTYVITETTIPAGWNLTNVTCGGKDPANLVLGAGETITCVFTNTAQPGRITITKEAGGVAKDFGFLLYRGSVLVVPPFTLNDATPVSSTITFSLPHGQYVAVESAPSGGWRLANISCIDPSGGTSVQINNGQANIGLSPNEEVACTFTNAIDPTTGAITIRKSAVPTGTQLFAFTGSLGNFSLSDGGSQPASHQVLNLMPGTYVITETAVSGWNLAGLSCSGGSFSAAGRAVSVNLQAGQNVACTFTNTQSIAPLSSITVVKNAVPTGSQLFAFTGSLGNFSLSDGGSQPKSRSFTGLAAGTYVITETAVSGWNLSGISCTGGSGSPVVNGRAVTIPLGSGENVTCAFTNHAVPSGPTTVYLPAVMKQEVGLPNLAATLSVNTSVNPPLVTVIVQNQGNGSIDEPFWVDFYVNPSSPPNALTGGDRRWQRVSTRGIAWPVQTSLLANGSLTLTSAAGFDPAQTSWGPLPAGAYTFYAFVDSYDNNDPEGAVYVEIKESNEADNQISVPPVTISGAGLGLSQDSLPDPARFPPRRELR